MKTCSVAQCEARAIAKGMCKNHWSRNRYATIKAVREQRKLEATRWYQENKDKYLKIIRKRRGQPLPTRPEPAACECCGGPPSGQGSFHLDHCHETGKFRGWLCHSCNLGIGALGDTLAGVKAALEYLRRAKRRPKIQEDSK